MATIRDRTDKQTDRRTSTPSSVVVLCRMEFLLCKLIFHFISQLTFAFAGLVPLFNYILITVYLADDWLAGHTYNNLLVNISAEEAGRRVNKIKKNHLCRAMH